MNEPTIITMPLSTVENMTFELACRFQDLFDQIEEIFEELEDIKKSLTHHRLPRPRRKRNLFDPFQTFGKYC
jgi:hypothetical protein